MRYVSDPKNNKTSKDQHLIDWYRSAVGQKLARAEREVLQSMVHDLFGYQLVQLGALGADLDYLDGCPIRCRLLVSDCESTKPRGSVIAEPRHLPIASDSVDAVLLIHTLDFSLDPHQVLREVERVLIAEGRIVVVGFNPYSFWGLWRLARRWRGSVPWTGHFLSYPRLNDWLKLMGFDIERVDVMEFGPPTVSSRVEWLEQVGRRVWPMLAGVYAVRAIKRVVRVTPLRPRWPRLRVLQPTAIKPTIRQVLDD